MSNIYSFELSNFFVKDSKESISLYPVTKESFDEFVQEQDDFTKLQIKHSGFSPNKDQYIILINKDGKVKSIAAYYNPEDVTSLLYLISALPESIEVLKLEDVSPDFNIELFYIMWALDQYNFEYFKKSKNAVTKLLLHKDICAKKLSTYIRSHFLGRNLVNLPAETCTPEFMQELIENIGKEFKAEVKTITGDKLLKQGYNLIHAVGRGVKDKNREPRLVHLCFNAKTDYKHIALVGKGVTFDTGGLNIKTGSYMDLMKKDMGGSACVLAIALQIMQENLKIKLDLFIPLAENNVAANSFRPGDIFTAYNGKTVEITNTDAEGRLLLADALAAASELNPDFIFDIATLTGAARVAVGDDLAALFTDNDEAAEKITEIGKKEKDLLWRLPMHEPYNDHIKGNISDLVNSAATGFAGASTAALFLKEFVKESKKWIHIDAYCWNKTTKKARPKGGEVMCLRAIREFISQNFIEVSR